MEIETRETNLNVNTFTQLSVKPHFTCCCSYNVTDDNVHIYYLLFFKMCTFTPPVFCKSLMDSVPWYS